ncbi:hypothetical protein CBI38_21290 [Rhodococcus oxybenzonivorans]|uniref:High-affinity choline uptake protein BetT n=1 Tax=Rhodococcus oxybenzonivorans TaxID=1990687 RepID=A0A2S2BYM6_9NOCA|nr:hypothetical protein CBI38_21290 [Rhodococcus oxybenzonivorans]
MLEQYPGAPILAVIATFTGMLFYVTSADSGALVMSHFSSRITDNESDGPAWVRIFWAGATGLLTLAMLMIGGIATLQNATIIMGLPLAVVIVFLMLGLFKAFQVEQNWAESARLSLPKALSSRSSGGTQLHGLQRIERSMRFPGAHATDRYATAVVGPALREVADELRAQGVGATVGERLVESCGIHSYHPDVPFEVGADLPLSGVSHRTPHPQLRPRRTETGEVLPAGGLLGGWQQRLRCLRVLAGTAHRQRSRPLRESTRVPARQQGRRFDGRRRRTGHRLVPRLRGHRRRRRSRPDPDCHRPHHRQGTHVSARTLFR